MRETSTIIVRNSVRRPIYKRIAATPPGVGFMSIPDGAEVVYYTVLLDHSMLNAMAIKAAQNKSGKSADGPLIVKVLEKRRIP